MFAVSYIRKTMCGQETELEMTRRHVQQGARHLAQQRELVAKLRANGQSTEAALQLLATFEATQQQHKAHLARLEGGPMAAADKRGGV